MDLSIGKMLGCWVTNVNSLLVLQNFTTARKSQNNVAAFSCGYHYVTLLLRVSNCRHCILFVKPFIVMNLFLQLDQTILSTSILGHMSRKSSSCRLDFETKLRRFHQKLADEKYGQGPGKIR